MALINENPTYSIKNFKIKTYYLIIPSTIISIIFFIITFYPIYFYRSLINHEKNFFTYYVYFYLIILLLVFFFSVLYHRYKSIGLSIFIPYVTLFGFHPLVFIFRSHKITDILGLILSIKFCIISFFSSSVKMLFPGFLLLFIYFLSSYIFGLKVKWEFRRRN
jgi:hypothetical protein